jgi:hypothetical protein
MRRESLDFWRRFFTRFDRRHPIAPDSAKTDGNLVHGSACRNTDDFLVPVTAALIGRLMTFPRKD